VAAVAAADLAALLAEAAGAGSVATAQDVPVVVAVPAAAALAVGVLTAGAAAAGLLDVEGAMEGAAHQAATGYCCCLLVGAPQAGAAVPLLQIHNPSLCFSLMLLVYPTCCCCCCLLALHWDVHQEQAAWTPAVLAAACFAWPLEQQHYQAVACACPCTVAAVVLFAEEAVAVQPACLAVAGQESNHVGLAAWHLAAEQLLAADQWQRGQRVAASHAALTGLLVA